jgi:hypothetical protein
MYLRHLVFVTPLLLPAAFVEELFHVDIPPMPTTNFTHQILFDSRLKEIKDDVSYCGYLPLFFYLFLVSEYFSQDGRSDVFFIVWCWGLYPWKRAVFLCKCVSVVAYSLTLNPLTWNILWAPNYACRWQMGFHSAFKGLRWVKKQEKIMLFLSTPWKYIYGNWKYSSVYS